VKAKSRRAAQRRAGRQDRADVAKTCAAKKVLVVDIGGTSVKILASGHKVQRSLPSGPKMTPKQMVSGVKKSCLHGRCSGWSASSLRTSRCGTSVVTERHVSVDVTTRPICDRFAQMRFAKALSSPVGFG
jgi:hypothetical protein